ncbi:MAG TPA: hypothetical protein VMV91_08470 [Rhodocyclaceae bacterium]|nr:hypothetical protein [Rhodocyclaceae bacterium]
MRALLPLAIVALTLAACASTQTSGVVGSGFDPSQLAQTDIDRVAEADRDEVFTSLRLLAEKLYRRNPREWKKGGSADIDAALARLFDPTAAWRFPELAGSSGSDAIVLAFREDYRGDRVLALIAGLSGMIQNAFNDKTEFYMTDELDPQKLYNAARNVEIAVWRLSHARDPGGELLLLSNEAHEPQNLSFEREFGKIIGDLDLLSRIVADQSLRTIVKVIQSLASAVFLPVAGIR